MGQSFNWDNQKIKDFPYSYNVWLGKCPHCLKNVDKESVGELENGLAVCPYCLSYIGVKWGGIGKSRIKFLFEPNKWLCPKFKEILFEDVCEKLKNEQYFIFRLDGVDDQIDTYMDIFHENPELGKIFRSPKAQIAFLVEKNKNTYYWLFNGTIDTFMKLIMLAIVEPNQIKVSVVENNKRLEKALLFKIHYNRILENNSFNINL